ncbi:hypothetical protein GY45DRAFT_1361351 [Cubamyces sp. BRFM 1775]|nr:hypothetical protein GY45DRAFT_1361351 [Cubamyces sp. BRFM 1775]
MVAHTNPATSAESLETPASDTAVPSNTAAAGPERPSVLDELIGRTFADIADEVSRLRAENAAIREDKTRLESDVRDLKTKIDRVLEPITPGRREPTDIDVLPPELLLHIFRAARAPRHQHDPSVSQGPRSLWLTELRFRKGLILVCKKWSGPATEALYEDIVLRRMGQALALADTLTAATSYQRGLADLVKSIRLDPCGVLPECADAVRGAFRTILERCTALRAFELNVDVWRPNVVDESEAADVFFPLWILDNGPSPGGLGRVFQERLSSPLRVLDLSIPLTGTRVIQQLHTALSYCAAGLEVLKLGPYDEVPGEVYDISMLPPLSLHGLQELYIYVDRHDLCFLLCQKWTMPALRRLTARDARAIPHALLETHGSQLRYLHLFPQRTKWLPLCQRWHLQDHTGIELLPKYCPALEHLVLSVSSEPGPSPLAIDSRSLRFLDIWTLCAQSPGHQCRAWQSCCSNKFLADSTLPALRGVRHLWELHVDLPMICDPAREFVADEQVVHFFPRAQFLQAKRHVISDRLAFCPSCGVPQIAVLDTTAIQMPSWVVESSLTVPVQPIPPLSGELYSDSSSDEEEDLDDDDEDPEAEIQNVGVRDGGSGSGTDSDSGEGSDYEPGDDESDDDYDSSDEGHSAQESDGEPPAE